MKRFLAAIIVVAILSFGWYSRALKPVNQNDETRSVVTIPQGSALPTIATLLEEKGLIRSARAFSIFTRLQGKASALQAGSFSLQQSMSASDIVAALSGEMSTEAVVTIPEGYTIKDIDALLAEKELIKAGEFIVCARMCDLSAYEFLPPSEGLAQRGGRVEGYLYPDTYFVFSDAFTAESFMIRLLDTFKKRVVDDLAADIKGSGKSLHEIITMASLIEEETRKEEERKIVSGILWKRFDAKMGLGVDAAVRYILDKPTDAITESDLNTDSPYNLRKFRGLPPGPIANPSLSSIEAAITPEESPYWYYLHGTDGQIRYAETNEGHNENRAKYLR